MSGEKSVAVPFSPIKVGQKDSGDRYLVIDTFKDALEQVPSLIHDNTKGAWIEEDK